MGEGEILNLTRSKIHINFINSGERKLRADITLRLGLLKKYLHNLQEHKKIFDTTKSKKNTTQNINHIEENKTKLNKEIKRTCVLKDINKKIQTDNEEQYIQNLCKNKSMTFYRKYINEYMLDVKGEYLKRYICHYIKFENNTYIRLNHICEIIGIESNNLDKFIKNKSIKVSYKGSCINGLKFIRVDDCYNIINNLYIDTDEFNIFKYIVTNIEKDSSENINNSIPYWKSTIDKILDNKGANVSTLAKEWKISENNIKIVELGFAPQLSKLKLLIKENKVDDSVMNNDEIRIVKGEYSCFYDMDVDNTDIDNNLDGIEVSGRELNIDKLIYEALEYHNYKLEDITIYKDGYIKDNKIIKNINIDNIKSVSTTISLLEYISCEISDYINKDIKLILYNIDIKKFISELMETDMKFINMNIYNEKCYLIANDYDYKYKKDLLDENKDYIEQVTGYTVDIEKYEYENITVNKIDKTNKESWYTKLSNDKKGDKSVKTKETLMEINTVEKSKDIKFSKVKTDSLNLENRNLRIDIKLGFLNIREREKLYNSQYIEFNRDAIHSFDCGSIDNKYSNMKFEYIKYKDKIYVNINNVNDILKSKLYIEDIIKVKCRGEHTSNKFCRAKNILKSIDKISKNKVNEEVVRVFERSVDLILKIQDSITMSAPYWALILDSMMFDIKISKEELNKKWEIDEYNMELMSLGFEPSKREIKVLIKELL